MRRAEIYRDHAETCLQLAARIPADERPALLRIAEAWLRLAEEALPGDAAADSLAGNAPSSETLQ